MPGVRLHRLNTFDDDNEVRLFEEPPRRPPRARQRGTQRRSQLGGPQRSGSRRPGSAASSNSAARLAGLIGIAILIVFGFVLLIGSCSGQSNGDYAAYINAMRPLAQDSASVGQKFATELGTSGLTMETFQSDLTSWSQQETNDYIAAQRLVPPGLLQSAHAEALATFQLRATSLYSIASALKIASEKHDSSAVAGAALASYAQLLTASDVVWEQLYKLAATQILSDRNVGNVIVPASQIVTNPDIVSAHSLAIAYARVGTPTTSGGHISGVHGSALISTTAVQSGTPTQLSTTTSTTVSASTSSLVIDVVIEDSGNYPEVNVPVTLTVKVGGKSVYTTTQTVAEIAPHAQATVAFSNLQLPASAFGNNASISVNITKVRGEAKLDNNAATYPVLFQLAPS